MTKLQIEPYKELVDGLLEEFQTEKALFAEKYADRSYMSHLRWQSHKEALLVDQLSKLSSGSHPSDAIGEYVVAFFNADDDGDFDI